MAELRQKQARIALDAARSVVTALQEQIARNAAAFEARLGCSEDGDSWLVRYQQSARLGDRLELAEAKAQAAEGKYREASTARTKIATEVEASAVPAPPAMACFSSRSAAGATRAFGRGRDASLACRPTGQAANTRSGFAGVTVRGGLLPARRAEAHFPIEKRGRLCETSSSWQDWPCSSLP